MATKFEFGIDSMPFLRSWPGESPKYNGPWPRFRSDGSGVKMTPFGREINGIPEIELIKSTARRGSVSSNWNASTTRTWQRSINDSRRLRILVCALWKPISDCAVCTLPIHRI